jgi:hypothetical protein
MSKSANCEFVSHGLVGKIASSQRVPALLVLLHRHYFDLFMATHAYEGYAKEKRTSRARDGYVPVLIIGAGASGISMGYHLKTKLNFHDFRILDRQSGIGGESHIVSVGQRAVGS